MEKTPQTELTAESALPQQGDTLESLRLELWHAKERIKSLEAEGRGYRKGFNDCWDWWLELFRHCQKIPELAAILKREMDSRREKRLAYEETNES